MSKNSQRLISWYLVLCLASAGAIGISPILHQWVEHGGRGTAHTHSARLNEVAEAAHIHAHEIGQPHEHEHDSPSTFLAPKSLFAHGQILNLQLRQQGWIGIFACCRCNSSA